MGAHTFVDAFIAALDEISAGSSCAKTCREVTQVFIREYPFHPMPPEAAVV